VPPRRTRQNVDDGRGQLSIHEAEVVKIATSGVDTASAMNAIRRGVAPVVPPWALIGAGPATVVQAKLSSWASALTLVAFCVQVSASNLVLEIYAGFRPAQSAAFLVRFWTWMDTHTDEVIIAESLALGLWLVAKGI
jgi:hypothetical protein